MPNSGKVLSSEAAPDPALAVVSNSSDQIVTATRPSNFPRHRKLLKPFEFAAVLKDGKRYVGKYVVLAVRRSPQRLARLGLAIAKKHAKLAGDRNQIKRIARESFRVRRLDLPSVEIVVLTRSREKKAAAPDQKLLRMEFDELFNKIAISKPLAQPIGQIASAPSGHPTQHSCTQQRDTTA